MDIGNESGEALYSNAGYRQVSCQGSTWLKLSGMFPPRAPSCSLCRGSHCAPSALHWLGSGCGTLAGPECCLHGFLWQEGAVAVLPMQTPATCYI